MGSAERTGAADAGKPAAPAEEAPLINRQVQEQEWQISHESLPDTSTINAFQHLLTAVRLCQTFRG